MNRSFPNTFYRIIQIGTLLLNHVSNCASCTKIYSKAICHQLVRWNYHVCLLIAMYAYMHAGSINSAAQQEVVNVRIMKTVIYE